MGAELSLGGNVSKGTRIRLSGKRRNSRRGPLLVTADGDVWVLECADEITLPAKGEVIVEGVVSGLDRLSVDWIGVSPQPVKLANAG